LCGEKIELPESGTWTEPKKIATLPTLAGKNLNQFASRITTEIRALVRSNASQRELASPALFE
jgi:hypothetical protein